jgi:hypothetical protein
VVIRNWYLLAVAVLDIWGALGIYWTWMPSLLAWCGLVIFAYSVWLLFLEWRGIIPWLPIFALTRVRLPVEAVRET